MKLKVVLDEGAYMPEKAHSTDAGFDLRIPMDCKVCAGHSILVPTGVHIEIPEGYVGMIKSKSGLNSKYGLVNEGVIDANYTGQIFVKMYNHSNIDYPFKRGDKLTQLVILPIPFVELELAAELEETERGEGGLGSTGK